MHIHARRTAGRQRVVAVDLGLEVAVADPVRPHGQDPEPGRRHAIELREVVEQLLAGAANPRRLSQWVPCITMSRLRYQIAL